MVKIVTYDLRTPGRDYQHLYRAIQSLGAWCHCLDSVWMVSTVLSSIQIRDQLKPVMDANDQLFVGPVGPEWAAAGVSADAVKWLRTHLS